MLKGLVLGYAKDDINILLKYADQMVLKIHDWSVCDSFCLSFKITRQYKKKVLEWVLKCAKREDEFSQRVATVMMLTYYLEKDTIDLVLQTMEELTCLSYYTQMAVAWCIATAYPIFSIKVNGFLDTCKLDDWTYNKAIQKMRESYKITKEDKEMLKKRKR